MDEDPDKDADEQISFRGGWKGLYIFILVYGLLQVILLYLFTRAYN